MAETETEALAEGAPPPHPAPAPDESANARGDDRGPIEKVATCPHCGKSFFGRRDAGVLSNFHRHVRSHTDERPYVCQVCGIAFKTPSNLKRHVRRLHEESTTEASSGDEEHRRNAPLMDEEGNPVEWFKANHRKGRRGKPLFRCDECVKVYNSKWSLSEHQRKVHGGETDEVECDACGAVLSSMTKLRRHKQQSCIFRDFSEADEDEGQPEPSNENKAHSDQRLRGNQIESEEVDPAEGMVVAATTTTWEMDIPADDDGGTFTSGFGIASPVAVAPLDGTFPSVLPDAAPSRQESRKRRRSAGDELEGEIPEEVPNSDSKDHQPSSTQSKRKGRSTAKSRSMWNRESSGAPAVGGVIGSAVYVCTESIDCEAFFRSRKALAAHILRRHSS
jgi:hypothetical protein